MAIRFASGSTAGFALSQNQDRPENKRKRVGFVTEGRGGFEIPLTGRESGSCSWIRPS